MASVSFPHHLNLFNVALLLWNLVWFQSKPRTENVHPTPCSTSAMGIAWRYSFRSCCMQHMGRSHGEILSLCRPAGMHEPTDWSWAKVPTYMLGFDILRFFMKLPEPDSPADRETQRATGLHISKHERHAYWRTCIWKRLQRLIAVVIPDLWY